MLNFFEDVQLAPSFIYRCFVLFSSYSSSLICFLVCLKWKYIHTLGRLIFLLKFLWLFKFNQHRNAKFTFINLFLFRSSLFFCYSMWCDECLRLSKKITNSHAICVRLKWCDSFVRDKIYYRNLKLNEEFCRCLRVYYLRFCFVFLEKIAPSACVSWLNEIKMFYVDFNLI